MSFLTFDNYVNEIRKVNKIARLGFDCDQQIAEMLRRNIGPTTELSSATESDDEKPPPCVDLPPPPNLEILRPFSMVKLVTRKKTFLLYGYDDHDLLVVSIVGQLIEGLICKSGDPGWLHHHVTITASQVIECSEPIESGERTPDTLPREFDDDIPF